MRFQYAPMCSSYMARNTPAWPLQNHCSESESESE